MPPPPTPRSFRTAHLITEVRVVSPGESHPEDNTIMETICDLVALDINAVMFMDGNPVPASGGWRRNTLQAHLHSRLLLFTLKVFARGRGMTEAQELRVWDLIQEKYDY